jgi:hypothetical protein
MLCFRLFSENNPAVPLANAVAQLREGQAPKDLYAVKPASFQQIPNAPFAYWVSERLRKVFVEQKPLSENFLVASGTGTLDDFRFLRLKGEIVHNEYSKWFPYAKGGSYSKYYYDQPLYVNWEQDGAEMKSWIVFRYGGGHWARNIRSTEHYFRPGLTWPRRTSGLSFRVLPSKTIFGDKGPAVFTDGDAKRMLLGALSILNTDVYLSLMNAQLARIQLAQSYEVGLIQETPMPSIDRVEISELATTAWSTKRRTDTATITSHAFSAPALAPCSSTKKFSRS